MAATVDETFWSFLYYIKRNPHKSIEAMTEQDLDAMVQLFAKVNETQCAFTITSDVAIDPLSYGTIDFPKTGGSDQNGVSATTPTSLLTDQALYPEDNFGG